MKRTGIIVATLLLLAGGFVAAERSSVQRCDPAGRATTLTQFREWQPATDTFVEIEADGQRHTIAYGPRCGSLASGPSAYVFDDAGVLVDWSSDIGDSPTFDKRWGAQRALSGRKVSRSDVR